MAIDMTTVKQIMHNNKEVVKIEDGLGKVLWQKVADQPYRRLEYIVFDGTNYCQSAEHNDNNRAYRLDYMQTGWADNGLCYPFGIWTGTAPQNILLTRNERSNTETGFEICRISNTAFGQYPPTSYLNNRMVAEMRWGTDTTVSYRLRNQSSSNYITEGSGAASGRTGTNTGNFFIGAINDGGNGNHSNANGMLVGRIYEVAIAGSNSFEDYGYAYVPCQRKSDGAIGFKQPHTDSFWPLRNKADGSIVTAVTAHMGPVVDDNWDGVTYTIEPSPIPTSTWHTVYDNSSGYELRSLRGSGWGSTGVPCNISDKATKLRIKFRFAGVSGTGTDMDQLYIRWANGSSYATYNYYDSSTTDTKTFDFDPSYDILFGEYRGRNTTYASFSWYRNGTWGQINKSFSGAYEDFVIYKVEEYY